MRLRREASLGIGAILVLQILLSMLAIALLTRMAPAIERVVAQNVYSGQATEEMMALLATSTEPAAVPWRFDEALGRARNNVTEEPERPLLAIVERERQAAFAGDPEARRATVAALRQIGQVNRDSMNRADAQAKRLGQAGAWAAAMLGVLALALGIVVYRRLRLRLELPIEELRRTTQRVRSGNAHARCAIGAGPHEVKQIAADLNWILDRWLHARRYHAPSGDEAHEAEVRRVLAWVLDRDPSPMAIFDARGKRISANRSAMLIDAPLQAPEGGVGGDTWSVQEVPGTSLRFASYARADQAPTAGAADQTPSPRR